MFPGGDSPIIKERPARGRQLYLPLLPRTPRQGQVGMEAERDRDLVGPGGVTSTRIDRVVARTEARNRSR